jgi:hypothetical protein
VSPISHRQTITIIPIICRQCTFDRYAHGSLSISFHQVDLFNYQDPPTIPVFLHCHGLRLHSMICHLKANSPCQSSPEQEWLVKLNAITNSLSRDLPASPHLARNRHSLTESSDFSNINFFLLSFCSFNFSFPQHPQSFSITRRIRSRRSAE